MMGHGKQRGRGENEEREERMRRATFNNTQSPAQEYFPCAAVEVEVCLSLLFASSFPLITLSHLHNAHS